MASNFDSIDLDFTWDGDLLLHDDGDLKDTSEDLLLSLRNEIQSIVKSNAGDWRESLEHGASLDDFIGDSNSRETARLIQDRVEQSLRILGRLSDFSVRVVPVHIHRVLIIVSVSVMATPENRMRAGDSVVVSFLYDYLEKGIFIPVDDFTKFSSGRNL